MKFFKHFCLLLAGGLLLGCNQSISTGDLNLSADNGGLTLPQGFQAVVVADSLGYGRHITVNDNGDVYMILRRADDGKGLVALRDEDGDGVADSTAYFGNVQGTGIQLYNGYLYYSSTTEVKRYKLADDELVPASESETVVSGFPEQGQHAAKSFTFDDSGNLYVNVGAPSNACQQESRTPGSPGMEPCQQLERQGGIWQFSATALNQTQKDDGTRYATGIRNAVALDWNSQIGSLYAVQHGRDQLNTLWPDRFTEKENAELPAEEFFKVNEGDNFGWPYSYYDWQQNAKMISPEYGGDGETPVEEGRFENPVAAYPGHWAPNDLLFYTANQFPEKYKNGAFIAFHGSWNRAPRPQQGYKVVFQPFQNDTVSGDYSEFATGFAEMENPQPGSAEHRPMGFAIGPDGSLYISDSRQGKIWRIIYTGS